MPLTREKGPPLSVREELVRLQSEKGLSLATIWKNKLFTVDFAGHELNERGAFITRGTAVKGALSPDGTEIAFSYCPDPGLVGAPPGEVPPRLVECAIPEYLGIIRADGTGFREYRNLRYPSGFCWSLQNSSLVLSVEDVEDNPPADDALHLLDLSAGTVRRLGNEDFAYVSSQCQSPDGRQIVYQLNRPGLQTIRIYSVAHGNSKDIASGHSLQRATWSPDGQWIAIFHYRESPEEYCAYIQIRPSGLDRKVLFHTELIYQELAWSPDSRFVAYSGYASGSSELRLWVRRLEDGAEDWFAPVSEEDVPSFQWTQNPKLLHK
jgi:Tol biopolymer transport system component